MQGEFTKEEAIEMDAVLNEIMQAFPRNKIAGFIGHFNSLFLFIAAVKKVAPNEVKG